MWAAVQWWDVWVHLAGRRQGQVWAGTDAGGAGCGGLHKQEGLAELLVCHQEGSSRRAGQRAAPCLLLLLLQGCAGTWLGSWTQSVQQGPGS